jgi:hypothetical protein
MFLQAVGEVRVVVRRTQGPRRMVYERVGEDVRVVVLHIEGRGRMECERAGGTREVNLRAGKARARGQRARERWSWPTGQLHRPRKEVPSFQLCSG